MAPQTQNEYGTIKPGLSLNAKIILACTIALVLFLSGSMIFMWKYFHELTSSPFTIGAEKIVEKNSAEGLTCSCQLEGINRAYKDSKFYFNTTTIWSEGEDYKTPGDLGYPSGQIDFSKLNVSQ